MTKTEFMNWTKEQTMMENLKKHEKYMKTIIILHNPDLTTAETSLRDLAKAVRDIIQQIEEIKAILENTSSTDKEEMQRMTLDEAIKHCEDVTEDRCGCAEEHRQLADWLKELKERRAKNEPQTMYYPQVDGITPSVIAKDEPQTDSEVTRNSLRKDCNGCRFIGTYDTEFPCSNCTRKIKDYYDAERTDCSQK